MAMKMFTREEVAGHNKRDDLWIIIDDDVYDLSSFGQLHPGGMPPLMDVAGQDATSIFYEIHRSSVLLEKRYKKLHIGQVQPAAGAAAAKGTAAGGAGMVPYGESAGFWRRKSPYYKESHHKFRAAVREFVEKEIQPTAIKDDEDGTYPSQELSETMGMAGIVACLVAAEPKAKEYIQQVGITLPGGIPIEEYDLFHALILNEELRRMGTYGLGDGLIGGNSIGLPPILKFGSKELTDRIVPDVLLGKKRCALAITEPYAGSDVAQIKTTGTLAADGSHYTVSGVKKWITGGIFAEYFSTLASTKQGMTMFVVERTPSGDGFSTKQILTSYSKAAGTSYVEYDNVKVPRGNVVGKEGHGFYYTMANFNHERWGMVCSGNRMSRLMVEECFRWAMSRKIFGKRLIDQPVIRFKLATMASEVEAVHSMLEDVTYQMMNMTPQETDKHLAGPIALLKYKQTRVAQLCADDACQIFGGRALTRSGLGVLVEKFHRSQKMQAILGGSEEIMADFAIRQAMKAVGGSPQLARL
eukprot:gb/GFBE01028964.1/.p1 GENE.gb/GFBE01028964.1/~~gb/GFBE01028964.1/.p1  ORF type:complete len:527 (+),score=143.33 gb/GFBE01028964.1/:1-1581(+)